MSQEVVNEIKKFEVLPLLRDILQQVVGGKLSVKDINNAAGKIRVRLAKFKELVEVYGESELTSTERKLTIDQLSYQIDKKKAILADFKTAVADKFSLEIEQQQSVSNEPATAKQIKPQSEKITTISIADYLCDRMQVSQSSLQTVIDANTTIAKEEEAKYTANLEALKKLKEELRHKQENTADTEDTTKQKSEDFMGLGNVGDLDNDYQFMDGNLNIDDPGFNMDELAKPEESEKEKKDKETDEFFNDNGLDLDDFNMNELGDQNFDDFDFDMKF